MTTLRRHIGMTVLLAIGGAAAALTDLAPYRYPHWSQFLALGDER